MQPFSGIDSSIARRTVTVASGSNGQYCPSWCQGPAMPCPAGLQNSWLPQLRRSGLQRLALLLPADPYNRGVIESLLWLSASQRLPYEVQYFAGLAEALDWVTAAERLTADADWRRSWREPALLRAHRLRWRQLLATQVAGQN